MEIRFLLIGDASRPSWSQVLNKALLSLGILEVINEPSDVVSILQNSYSVIIIDASEVDDLKLTTDIRVYQPYVPIVVVTASPTWERARDLFRLGISDYIRKVAVPNDLVDILKRLSTE